MGDRANIVVLNDYRDKEGVFLYGHSAGPDLARWAADALASPAARRRWNGGPYLTRIIFHQILAGHGDSTADTGFGISTGICDNSYPILVIDPGTESVWVAKEAEVFEAPTKRTSFADFTADPAPILAQIDG